MKGREEGTASPKRVNQQEYIGKITREPRAICLITWRQRIGRVLRSRCGILYISAIEGLGGAELRHCGCPDRRPKIWTAGGVEQSPHHCGHKGRAEDGCQIPDPSQGDGGSEQRSAGKRTRFSDRRTVSRLKSRYHLIRDGDTIDFHCCAL